MFVLFTDYTLRKIMSADDQCIVAMTGRAHCQRQAAFFLFVFLLFSEDPNPDTSAMDVSHIWIPIQFMYIIFKIFK